MYLIFLSKFIFLNRKYTYSTLLEVVNTKIKSLPNNPVLTKTVKLWLKKCTQHRLLMQFHQLLLIVFGVFEEC